MPIALGIIFALILIMQIPALIKKKDTKVLIIYCSLMGIAILYSYAVFLKWNLPRPTELIIKVTKPIVRVIYGDVQE